MASRNVNELPLVVIVGPTASGKTALAIELAQQFKGEIICADSRTIYKGLDIGTAKPTVEERALVPHWGLDLVEPGERFSAADFKMYAEKKIAEIRARGKVPFLVGGSGLYIDAVVFNYTFGGEADTVFRDYLEGLTIEQLQEYCIKNNVELPENHKNKRYLIRSIERKGANVSVNQTPIANTIIVGITTNKDILRQRIEKRALEIFANGVVEEAISIGARYGWKSEAMTGNIYPLIHSYINKDLTKEELRERFVTLDWRLAKRQMTWMRRNKYIIWNSLDEARDYLRSLLAKE